MSGHSHTPTKNIQSLGYFLAGVKELVNGYDSGAGLVKLPIWILGLSVTIAFAPFVITGGGIYALLYFARALYEEYEKNKLEQEKKIIKDKLIRQTLLAEEELSSLLQQEVFHDSEVQTLLLHNRLVGKSEGEIKTFIEKIIRKKLAHKYPVLNQHTTVDKDTNKELLKHVLNNYFAALLDNEVDPRLGHKLPKQKKILSLIQDVTGFNPHRIDFHCKVHEYLKEDPELQAKFHYFIPKGTLVPAKLEGIKGFLVNSAKSFASFFKKQRTLRHVGKKLMDFINDFGTGAGLATATMTMFGIIVVGGPIAWIPIVIILGSGLVFGLTTLAYQKMSGDRSRRNMRNLDEETKQQKNRLQLTKRLIKIKKNPQKLFSKKNNPEFEDDIELDEHLSLEQQEKLRLIQKNITPKIPKSVYLRMALGLLGQVILGVSIAMIISLGIIWIGTVLFPVLPLLVPTLGFGGVLSIFYIYRGIKAEVKSIKSELNRFNEVEEAKILLKEKYKNNPEVSLDLSKDNRVLLQEVLNEYILFIENKGGQKARRGNGKFPKQEKIFQLIESVSGIMRPDDINHPLLTGDDKFYNQLAQYLKGSSSNSEAANALTQRFKNLFTPVPPKLTTSRVDADSPEINQKQSFLMKTGLFLKDNLFTILGILSVGLMVPLFLMGPQMIPVIAIAAVVLAGYAIAKFASYQSKKNLTALNEEAIKNDLIDRKHHLSSQNKKSMVKTEKIAQFKSHYTFGASFEKSHQKTLATSRSVLVNRTKPFTLAPKLEEKAVENPAKKTVYQSPEYPELKISGGYLTRARVVSLSETFPQTPIANTEIKVF